MRLKKAESHFIDVARVARLATVDPSGAPHNVPICPLFEDGRVYFASGAKGKKIQNILSNPRVAIVFDDYVEAWNHLKGILVVGEAHVVETAEFRRLREALYTKFLMYPTESPLEEGETVIVEIVPQRKTSWGFE